MPQASSRCGDGPGHEGAPGPTSRLSEGRPLRTRLLETGLIHRLPHAKGRAWWGSLWVFAGRRMSQSIPLTYTGISLTPKSSLVSRKMIHLVGPLSHTLKGGGSASRSEHIPRFQGSIPAPPNSSS